MRVVLDSGPIIHLSWINRLEFLTLLFDDVLVSPIARAESLRVPAETRGLDHINSTFDLGHLRVQAPVGALDTGALGAAIDVGEAEAIQLAEETGADLLITDDAAARAFAEQRGLPVTGTIGILFLARERGLIPAVLPLAQELRRLGQWISDALIAQIEREERGGAGL